MSQSQRARVRVRILNEEYSIAGQRSAAELQAAAAQVNGILEKLSAASADASVGKLAILAAINLASELIELRQRTEVLEAALSGGTQRMIELLRTRTSVQADS